MDLRTKKTGSRRRMQKYNDLGGYWEDLVSTNPKPQGIDKYRHVKISKYRANISIQADDGF